MKKMVYILISAVLLAMIAPNIWAQEGEPGIQPVTDVRVTLAQTVAEMQNLRSELQALKGSIDSNSHLIQTQSNNTNLKLNDMDARIAALEDRLKIQGRQVTSAVSTVAPEIAAESELYQAGLNQVNSSEFLKAIATFKKFNTKFPKSPYADSAQYWIAECYFAMRDFEMAIKEFQNLIDNYRNSEKIPAALLKQGYAFTELDMESDANLFFSTLIKKYPHSKEAKDAKDFLERQKQLKEEAKTKPNTAPGGIPLAPGVELQDQKADKIKKPAGKYD
jgi:tol-pal system protein YbgF